MNIHSFRFLPILVFVAVFSVQCSGGVSSTPSPQPTTPPIAAESPSGESMPTKEMLEAETQAAPATAEPAPVDSSADSNLDGKSLAIERCSTCHAFSRVESAKKSSDGWTQTVQRMISKGAVLNPMEEQAVIKYLSETHPQ